MDLDSNVVGVDASVIGGVVSACDSGCRSGDPAGVGAVACYQPLSFCIGTGVY